MKNAILIKWLLVLSTLGSHHVFAAEESPDQVMAKDLGYFYGYSFGNMLKQGGSADVDMEALSKGLADSLNSVPPALNPAKHDAVIAEIRHRQTEMESRMKQAAEADNQSNLDAANAYLKHNLSQPGVEVTTSGLQYRIIEDKKGETAGIDATVVVHYRGKFPDGTVFDESGDTPAEFGLQQVIAGWTEGLQLMSPGDKFEFFIHPDLAYGAGAVGQIPPNSLLVFEVELLEVK